MGANSQVQSLSRNRISRRAPLTSFLVANSPRTAIKLDFSEAKSFRARFPVSFFRCERLPSCEARPSISSIIDSLIKYPFPFSTEFTPFQETSKTLCSLRILPYSNFPVFFRIIIGNCTELFLYIFNRSFGYLSKKKELNIKRRLFVAS